MAKAKKLPSGNWRCMANITVNGKKLRKSFTAETRREAEYLAAEWVRNGHKEVTDCTVAEAIEQYISSRTNTCSPSTIRGYRQIQRVHFQELHPMKVSDVTTSDLQRAVNKLAKDHSPKSVRNAYALLLAAIESVLPDVKFRVTLPQRKVMTYNTPTNDEVSRLLEEADGDLYKAILLSSTGTMRRGEICAFDYEDIDGNTIHVHKCMIRDDDGNWLLRDIPKTSKSDRYIEYPPEVIEKIGTGSGRVMAINPRALTLQFMRLRDRLGIKCRFHDLRHYAASVMHAIGVPDQYIMERGGWSSDTVLKSVYRNVLDDQQKKFTDQTNDYFRDHFF